MQSTRRGTTRSAGQPPNAPRIDRGGRGGFRRAGAVCAVALAIAGLRMCLAGAGEVPAAPRQSQPGVAPSDSTQRLNSPLGRVWLAKRLQAEDGPAPQAGTLPQIVPPPEPLPGSERDDAAPRTPPQALPPERSRLPLLPGLPPELRPPQPTPEIREQYGRFIEQEIVPENTLELVVGQPRILRFRETPVRIYLPDEEIISFEAIPPTGREIAVVGREAGSTALYIWVRDPDDPQRERILGYFVRVVQDPGFKERLESVYSALEEELNRHFPDSFVKLSLVGDQLIVRGQAKDVVEAAQIIRVLEEHAPPRRRQQRADRPDLTISQTSYLTDDRGDSLDALGITLDRIAAAGLEGESNVVNLLSIPGEQQVMLRVTVAEVNRSALRSLGSNLTIGSGSTQFQSAFPAGSLLEDATGLLAAEGGTLSIIRGDLRLTLNALRQLNLARTLAEPNLVTLHGRPARFQAGGQFPVPAARVGFGTAAQGVEFVPFGVQLQFIPFIVDRDKIRLSIAASVSTRDDAQSTDISGSNVPGLNTRNFQNTVELREGQTLAVAGLIQSNYGANASRVPFLGDLPWIGRLFASDAATADEQEVVVLITPELVHPLDCDAALPLPGAELFEPGDAEFYLKGRLESRRAYDFRSPVRTDHDRLMRYHHCDDVTISGPYGPRDGRWGECPPGFLVETPPAVSPVVPASATDGATRRPELSSGRPAIEQSGAVQQPTEQFDGRSGTPSYAPEAPRKPSLLRKVFGGRK
ncbi:MAG TPA: pilus assembly protein N-terminal domain-containing protein [Planctomycetaceae bacterium]|nr:pilus assembly protein N-terminal domain-containing protein [Planctomycetaceae bacterium]